ncbi:MAG: bifunctional 5,10-methylenetetrahydrofolate dehydrogenase/5,10-methenyltetrahydrofolate cyclohydrolase [Patescibacteria group bacterium]
MKLIDGRAMAQKIREDIREEIQGLPSSPGLGVLLVGDDPASAIYVNLKERAAQEAGITTDIRRLPATTSDAELITIIKEWNKNASIDGILVQLPLPQGHNADAVIAEMDPEKDVDGFHPSSIAASEVGASPILSPVYEAIVRCLGATDLDPRGASAVILANSDTFAKPLSRLLQRIGLVTAIMDPDELDSQLLRTTKVIISAIGRCHFIKADLVSPGSIIIDVGTSHDIHGKVCGDADAVSLAPVDGWLTPVPGGIGPMTVALLLKNVVSLYKRKRS